MTTTAKWGRFICPRTWNSLPCEGVATAQGVLVGKEILPWDGNPLPEGTPCWVDSGLSVEPLADKAERERQEAIEDDKARAQRLLDSEAEAEALEKAKASRWLEFFRDNPGIDEKLPGWKTAEVVSLRGLSANSWGGGDHTRGGNLTHIYHGGKLLCGYEPKFSLRVGDDRAPTCRGCLRRAKSKKL
jgi:hypothetical protein